ncbi:hypothetical protein ABZZ17_23780 [Streptomyces sp. NPDC006512]|uniref:hypothetical protein n=1 Tax=Streptomyces sp. NPDC006512 TaxID=3154307 RepID=UPI0033B694D3
MVKQRVPDGSGNQPRCDHHAVLNPRHHALSINFLMQDNDRHAGLVVGRDHPAIALPVDDNNPRSLFCYGHARQLFRSRTAAPARAQIDGMPLSERRAARRGLNRSGARRRLDIASHAQTPDSISTRFAPLTEVNQSTGIDNYSVFAAPAYSMTINRPLGKVRPSRSTRCRSKGFEHGSRIHALTCGNSFLVTG